MSGSGTLLHAGSGSNQDEEAQRLAQEAPDGDAAFTLLYDLFEQRVFNFCHRLLGSVQDAADATQETFLAVLTGPDRREGHDSDLRSYLFGAAHDACHDVIVGRTGIKQRLPRPEDEPGVVFVDPERASLLSSLQDDVRAANRALADAEREVLALRELEYFSYAEIADIMRVHRDSVAELLASARVRLRDELRGSALAHGAGSTPECRHALPLVATAQDAQPRSAEEREWLGTHLETCEPCRARREAMEEAGIAYRAWLGIVPFDWLREATLARVAEQADTGGGQVPGGGERGDGDGVGTEAPGAEEHAEMPVADAAVAIQPASSDRHRDRRRFTLGAVSTLLLLLGVGAALVIASTGGSKRTPATSEARGITDPPTATSAAAPLADSEPLGQPRRKAPRRPLTGTPTGESRSRLDTRLGTSSPQPPRRPRRRSKPVTRAPIRGGAEGGGFVPKPTSPSPPSKATPPAPTAPVPPAPSGGTVAPSGVGCTGTPGGSAPC